MGGSHRFRRRNSRIQRARTPCPILGKHLESCNRLELFAYNPSVRNRRRYTRFRTQFRHWRRTPRPTLPGSTRLRRYRREAPRRWPHNRLGLRNLVWRVPRSSCLWHPRRPRARTGLRIFRMHWRRTPRPTLPGSTRLRRYRREAPRRWPHNRLGLRNLVWRVLRSSCLWHPRRPRARTGLRIFRMHWRRTPRPTLPGSTRLRRYRREVPRRWPHNRLGLRNPVWRVPRSSCLWHRRGTSALVRRAAPRLRPERLESARSTRYPGWFASFSLLIPHLLVAFA
jgi:hypothetical protein